MDISKDYQSGPLERLALMFGGEDGKGSACIASAELLGTFAWLYFKRTSKSCRNSVNGCY